MVKHQSISMMSPNKNYGLRESLPSLGAPVFGAITEKVLMPNHSWAGFLPEYEKQSEGDFDTYACTVFGTFNCIETYLFAQYGIKKNFSDRFTAVMSGTIPGWGNYIDAPARSIAKDGVIEESEYPFVGNEKEYYKIISNKLKEKVKQSLTQWEIQSEWVDWAGCDPEELWGALQYSPLEVTVLAWYPPKDGTYLNTGSDKTNHVVMLFAGEYKKWWLIYDHYEQSIKKLSWDFYFGSAMRHIMKPRMLELIKGDKGTDVFALDKFGVKHLIFDESQFERGLQIGLWGDSSLISVRKQKDVDALPLGNAIVLA